jgi:hypothetical protein
MKIGSCILIIGFLLLVVLALLFKGSKMKWPEVADCSALLLDCTRIAREERGIVQRSRWPSSVAVLSPALVKSGHGYVLIITSGGGIGPAWGYVVFVDEASVLESLTGYQLTATSCAFLYRFVTQE